MKKKRISIVIFPLLVLGLVFIFFPYTKTAHPIQIPVHEKHRGVCWVGSPYSIDSTSILDLVENNVNWISQTPFGWQRGYDSPNIGNRIGRDDGWWGETDNGLIKTTRLAKKYGISTILKPHIWLRDDQGKWRGEIQMKSEEDWKAWFSDYETFILHYAKLAEQEQMEMLCIGTELHRTCVEREQDWRNLISKIRKVYSGKLTYAANFADEYEEVAFWDVLDYIGIQAYFSVAQTESPSIEEIRRGWKEPIAALSAFSEKHEKPILFTEVGYKSTANSGIEPWAWPQRINAAEREKIFSESTQANLYEAMFAELSELPFLAGFHLWKWYPEIPEHLHSQRRRSRFDQAYNIDFTPQRKQAEQVMKDWYGRMEQ